MIQTLKNMIRTIPGISQLFASLLFEKFYSITDEYLYMTAKDGNPSVNSVCYKSLNYPITNCWSRIPS